MGPDGSGKSAIADGIAAWAGRRGPVRRFHHRFGSLPVRKEARQPTTEPHRDPTYPPWLTVLKVLYLFADQLIGLARQRAFLRDGGWIVLERGWWDLVVDPVRYRLDPRITLAARLAPLLPGPHRTVILLAHPDVIAARKSELPPGELQRQLGMWRTVAARIPRSVVVDSSPPIDTVLATVLDALGRSGGAATGLAPATDASAATDPGAPAAAMTGAGLAHGAAAGGWVALPPGRPGRWWVPRRPRRAARGALILFQPMTASGRLRWELLRLAVASRMFGLLPAGALPPLPDLVLRSIPRGGTVSVRRGTRDGRAVAVVIEPSGRPVLLAKIAHDPESRAALAREVRALEAIAPALRPPLRAPRVLAAEAGVALFEPVAWRPRPRPWHLPVELARGIARLHLDAGGRVTAGEATAGHGDFAPWNVMRTDDGWVVIDWESATLDAPPFDDLFHYLVQGHALLGHPSATDVVDGVTGRGPLGPAVRAYAGVLGTEVDSLPDHFLGYLDRSAGDLRLDRPDGVRGSVARQRLRDVLHGR